MTCDGGGTKKRYRFFLAPSSGVVIYVSESHYKHARLCDSPGGGLTDGRYDVEPIWSLQGLELADIRVPVPGNPRGDLVLILSITLCLRQGSHGWIVA
jgi:hypothetical protein